MNKGYRIVIEEGLSQEQQEIAEKVANTFIEYANEHDGYWKGQTGGGWSSALRRGIYGQSWGPGIDLRKVGLVFRRVSRGRRVFGVIKVDHLIDREGNVGLEIGKNMCMCPLHRGGIKVSLMTQPEVSTYYETGNIKG